MKGLIVIGLLAVSLVSVSCEKEKIIEPVVKQSTDTTQYNGCCGEQGTLPVKPGKKGG